VVREAQERQIAADSVCGMIAGPGLARKALEGFCLVFLNTNEIVYLK
jgi:hypothetical protein